MKTLWKCLTDGMRSKNGDARWQIGIWNHVKKPLSICNVGFHASPTPLMAFGYVKPGIICKVQVDNKSIQETDKSCHESMVVLKAWKWEKADSVALAIFAAELVIHLYEERNPGNTKPRDAIESAKRWLKDPTEENRKKCYAAVDAYVDASDGGYAAYAAAAAAAYASDAAAVYADAAAAAYASDARKQIQDKCNQFIIERLESKQSLQG